jgi:hypothetical protein
VASSTGCFGDPEDGSNGACDSPCQPGYNPSNNRREYTCDTNGDWTSGRLTCTAKECDGHPYSQPTGTFEQNGNPHINCDSPVIDNHGTFGTECHASCTYGYDATSGSATYTCQNVKGSDTGYWCVFAAFHRTISILSSSFHVCRPRHRGGGSLVCEGILCKNELPGTPNGVANSQKCTAGQYTDNGDPNPEGGGPRTPHTFTGSICRTDPTTPNPDGEPTPHAMCKDGYEETERSKHDYVCDHTGHWVVGTKGGDNPYNPPDGPGGQGLVCLGQVCPDSGQTPHDGDCGGHCTSHANKEWPYTVFEPCYTENSASHSPTPKALHYSDTCADADPEAWGDDCHCSSSCAEGYSADGTTDGKTDRTFRCLQHENTPYFEPAKALTCKAVTCGDVMDVSNHPHGHMPEGEGEDP